MDDLSVIDVEAFTKGRLEASDTRVDQMLRAALTVCRRAAGWHVSPVKENDELVLDGPDSRVLWLPTRKLVEVTELRENGFILTPDRFRASQGDRRPVALRKRSNTCWSGDYGAIEITMSHGYTREEAADWIEAVLSMVDQMSLVPVQSMSGTSSLGLRSKQVDDVTYRWDSYIQLAETVLFSVENTIGQFALPTMEFL